MYAEIKRRWPDEPRAEGKRAFKRWRRTRAAKVTAGWSFVRWRAYAMKKGRRAWVWFEEGG